MPLRRTSFMAMIDFVQDTLKKGPHRDPIHHGAVAFNRRADRCHCGYRSPQAHEARGALSTLLCSQALLCRIRQYGTYRGPRISPGAL